jgi:hypothetical protein
MRYESAILRGNDKNATAREKHVGSNVAKVATFILNFFCLYNLLIYGWIHCNSGFWFPCYCALCKKIAYRELTKCVCVCVCVCGGGGEGATQ